VPRADSPAVSVLLAVHNGGAFLRDAIASVRAQTLRHWELVIASNGSTDDTESVAREAAALDPRIRIAVLPVAGKNRAYNHAWKLASGRYVCFFAADDLLLPTSLEERLAAAESAGPAGYSTCCLRTFSDNPLYDGLVFPRRQSRPNYSGGALLFDRALAEQVFPLPEEQPNEDTWTQLHLRAFGTGRHVPRPLYLYRIHGANSYGYGLDFTAKREGFLVRMHAYRLFEARHDTSDAPFIARHVRPYVKALDASAAMAPLRVLAVPGLDVRSKAVLMLYSSPRLFQVRNRWFRFLSGGAG
jgi:glycosyltransferase involved in cell wall biosynthesis